MGKHIDKWLRKQEEIKNRKVYEEELRQEILEYEYKINLLKMKISDIPKEREDEIEKSIRRRKELGEEEMFLINLMRHRTLGFMLLIIALGLFVPFFNQFCPSLSPWKINSEMWNSYVSIILGIVATLCSLLSIYLSFYAQKQTLLFNNNTIDDFNNIRREIHDSVLKIELIELQVEEIKEHIHKDNLPTKDIRPRGLNSKKEVLNENDLFEGEKTENCHTSSD